jgi:hypothetical protein
MAFPLGKRPHVAIEDAANHLHPTGSLHAQPRRIASGHSAEGWPETAYDSRT